MVKIEQGDLNLREHAAHSLATSFHKGMAHKQAPDEKQSKKEKLETIDGAGAVIGMEFEKLLSGEVDKDIANEVIKSKREEIGTLTVEVETLAEEIKVAEKPHMDKAKDHIKVAKYNFNAGVELLGITRATSVKKGDLNAADKALEDAKDKRKNGKKGKAKAKVEK